jgi:6-phosphofructokinase 1
MKRKIRSLGVLTPGGDAPGMNPAIRAVVRTAIHHGLRVVGIERGWYGVLNGLFHEMDAKSVSGIINCGGTILHTRRCPEFRDKNNRTKSAKLLKEAGIDALVVIGGNGSMAAAYNLMKEQGIPANVVPASIDNDIPGTDFTIGFDTAVNTAMEAIDKIRDTATSHERLFIVEVMGRENGFIALHVGLAAGAEAILIPEVPYNLNTLIKKIRAGQKRGKSSYILVVAEGAGDSNQIAKDLGRHLNIEVRLSILGHIQRGGVPTAFSRELACKLGAAAVELLVKGQGGYLIGAVSDKTKPLPLKGLVKITKKIDPQQLRLATMLSN